MRIAEHNLGKFSPDIISIFKAHLVEVVQQLQDSQHPRGVREEQLVLHFQRLQEHLGGHGQLVVIDHDLGGLGRLPPEDVPRLELEGVCLPGAVLVQDILVGLLIVKTN